MFTIEKGIRLIGGSAGFLVFVIVCRGQLISVCLSHWRTIITQKENGYSSRTAVGSNDRSDVKDTYIS